MTIDWSQPIIGRYFQQRDGALIAVDYGRDSCNPDKETIGVMVVSVDLVRHGTTIGGYQIRSGLANGDLVEITVEEFHDRWIVSTPWIEAISAHAREG